MTGYAPVYGKERSHYLHNNISVYLLNADMRRKYKKKINNTPLRDTPNYYGSGRTANRIILYLGGLSRERSVYFRFVFKKKKNLQFSVRVNVLDDRVEFYDPTVRGRRLVRYDGTEREREKKKCLNQI